MSRLVIWFPIGLVLGLGLVLFLLFRLLFGAGTWMTTFAAVVGGNTALWLLLGPLIAICIRMRTCRALDAFLANIVYAAEYAARAALADRPRP